MSEVIIQGYCPVCNQAVTNSDVVDYQGIELVFFHCGRRMFVEDLRKEPRRNRDVGWKVVCVLAGTALLLASTALEASPAAFALALGASLGFFGSAALCPWDWEVHWKDRFRW